MPFNLLLLPLIGGYFFISHFYVTAFYAARHTRERLIFNSALAGTFLLIASRIIVLTVAWAAPWLAAFWKQLVPFDYSGTAFGALALGLALPVAFNHFYPREKAYRRVVRRLDANALERLFLDATDRDQMVILDLDSGKVYVGLIQWTPPTPGSEDSFIRILPILSGYRKDDTHEVEFTTTYASVIQKTVHREEDGYEGPRIRDMELPQKKRLKLDDFVKVIPSSQVVSAGKFDHEAYRRFNTVSDDNVASSASS